MPETLSLVPNSLLQFRTIALPDGRKKRARFFEEELAPAPGPDGTPQRRVALRRLESDPETETEFWRENGEAIPVPAGEEGVTIRGEDVLEIFGDEWIPLPCFARLGTSGQGAFLPGPTNWARVRLRAPRAEEQGKSNPQAALEAKMAPGEKPRKEDDKKEDKEGPSDRSLRADLAFDTALEDGPHFTALRPQMRERGFALVSEIGQLGDFLSEDWLTGWLEEIYAERAPRRMKALAEESARPPLLLYQAAYLTLLEMLADSGSMPELRLTDEHDGAPVQVDLVLDLGNFRSCGILIEELPGARQREADSFALQLRDLSRVELGYDKPFSSRIEFARANFGRENYSRRSGRGHAFAWPSPVRTGPQAERLMAERTGTEGNTGLSAPKRYLWDTRPAAQGWVFNNGDETRAGARPAAPELPVNGPFRAQFAKILAQGKYRASREDLDAAQQLGPCVLSRSELFSLMLEELLLQSARYMNSPEFRMTRPDSSRRRHLRSVMITMPPGMPLAVQRIFRKRAQAALKLASTMAGLEEPRLDLRLDEATATQLVWLHNEIKYRLGGEAKALYELYGRAPSKEKLSGDKATPLPTLRVASIDIGGGTMDLMIVRYTLDASDALVPEQEFRESFDVAGDDLLRGVIAGVIVPPIERALSAAGVPDARAFLKNLLDADRGNQTVQERYQRLLLTATLLEPAALHALELYEKIDPYAQGDLGDFRLGDSVRAPKTATAEKCRAFFSAQLSRHLENRGAPAVSFDILDTSIPVASRAVEHEINATLKGPLTNLCEAVRAWGCDVLLLSGRPSKLRYVRDLVASTCAVAPHHMFPLHDYAIGPHYPFRNVATGRIDDPKTTVVVGASICAQADRGTLPNFALRTGNFAMKSTARYLGRMTEDGQIKTGDVIAELPLQTASGDAPLSFDVKGVNGATLLGFRQLPAENWGATPLYTLDFTRPAPQLALPLNVKITRNPLREVEEEEEKGDYSAQEDFRIDDVTDATGAPVSAPLALRLQTALNPAGYWRDSGYIKLD